MICRAVEVGFAMMSDILCNFPMWIAAKRMGAGLTPFPSSIRSVYKGSGTLWLSLGPTTILEDFLFVSMYDTYLQREEGSLRVIGSAMTAGIVSALLLSSPIEYAITLSHKDNLSLVGAARSIVTKKLPYHISYDKLAPRIPPGTLAMCCRESIFVYCLFHLRPAVSSALHNKIRGKDHTSQPPLSTFAKLCMDVASGVCTAFLASPLSHPAARIAAYQQGHSANLKDTLRVMWEQEGRGEVSVGTRCLGAAKWLSRGLLPRTLSMAGTFTVFPIALRMVSSGHHD
jgi:hypothetical protein